MEDLEHLGVAEQALQVRRVVGLAVQLHEVGVAPFVAQLHHAQRVPAEAQTHGLGVDRHGSRTL